jgi:hypothetical protein
MPAPLDYHAPSTPAARRRPGPLVPLVLCCVIVPIMTVICVRIELLNARAGGYLPPPPNAGKWRVNGRTVTEYAWRQREGYRTNDPTLETRSLTPRERAELTPLLDQAEAHADLRAWVTFAGLCNTCSFPSRGSHRSNSPSAAGADVTDGSRPSASRSRSAPPR